MKIAKLYNNSISHQSIGPGHGSNTKKMKLNNYVEQIFVFYEDLEFHKVLAKGGINPSSIRVDMQLGQK